VLEYQIQADRPLEDDERAGALEIDAGGRPGLESVLRIVEDITRRRQGKP